MLFRSEDFSVPQQSYPNAPASPGTVVHRQASVVSRSSVGGIPQTRPMPAMRPGTPPPIQSGQTPPPTPPPIKGEENKLPAGVPERIGHYRILEVLGEGGMGFVYKAQHSFLDTIVAIKVIKDELAAHPDILKRFLQEAKLGISLDHPNIIRIHDAGEIGRAHV